MSIPTLSPNETTFVNVASTYVLPVVSGINIWVNVINIVVLARPIFKGSVYRYMMFISLFDVLTLSLIAFKPMLRAFFTNDYADHYVYVFFIGTFLMCSDLTTMAALIERIVRLGGRLKKNTTIMGSKKHPYKLVLLAVLVFSSLMNSPVLYVKDFFELEWFYKNVYFELCLTPNGWQHFWGKFVYAIGMVVNMAIFVIAIFLNTSIYKLMKKNARSLKQFIEFETAKSGEFIINIVHDIDDLHNYEDDDMDEVDLEKEISQMDASSKDTPNHSSKPSMKSRVRFQSAIEPPSGDLNTMESIASAKRSPLEMESIRKKLCDLVVSNSYIYLVGHAPFILVNCVQKLVNLCASYNILDSDNPVMAFFQALSNFLLYSSLGLTFFVQIIYNVKFRYVLKRAWYKLWCIKPADVEAKSAQAKTEEKIF